MDGEDLLSQVSPSWPDSAEPQIPSSHTLTFLSQENISIQDNHHSDGIVGEGKRQIKVLVKPRKASKRRHNVYTRTALDVEKGIEFAQRTGCGAGRVCVLEGATI
jgi:hypothetical protein